ncbi:hypothetical protein RFI_16865 [Reticulomyxa filosa]|uniref:Uncharacterized protein n=1 Tax=Reticulomyxa filosa TaxID=46433 RepID=X6N2Q6_RETFI|nr:hypothetical protein RFI_16865 [Reticulomyxa filosa]|eukprot:ETO20351.1 hypothetical protein RFI_16865 [Reticulomyxa filosa]
MKSSLMLVALHVLNVFLSLALNVTANTSETVKQKHSNQHINVNIMAISCGTLFNNMWKLIFEQCIQLCNNMANTSSLQISNNKSIQSTNQIILQIQSSPKRTGTPKVDNKYTHIHFNHTTDNTQIDTHISDIQVHNIDRKTKLEKNEMIFLKKNKTNSISKNSKVDVIISVQSWNRSCNSLERISIANIGCKLFWHNVATNTNTNCSSTIFFSPSIAVLFKQSSSDHQAHICASPNCPGVCHNFESSIKCYNVKFFYFLFLLKTNRQKQNKQK